MNNLYTVLLDYAGGTYISQVEGLALSDVLSMWLNKISDDDLRQWKIQRNELHAAANTGAVPLDGLQNVWCATGAGELGLILINVVATQLKTTN